MLSLIPVAEITAFFSVVMIDLVLAGDNAVVIGLAAAGLPAALRGRAIVLGILAATVLRIVFAATTMQLLNIIGLMLAGGLLLLWVCWKMWRELRGGRVESELDADPDPAGAAVASVRQAKTLPQAMLQIVIADVSMSLDNVLAVAGAARDHLWVLVFGLMLSIGLMGIAATIVARLLDRYHWIAYVGLLIIFYVALDMVWRGTLQLL